MRNSVRKLRKLIIRFGLFNQGGKAVELVEEIESTFGFTRKTIFDQA